MIETRKAAGCQTGGPRPEGVAHAFPHVHPSPGGDARQVEGRRFAPPLQRRLTQAEADRFYRPLNWQPDLEPAPDPIAQLAAWVPSVNASWEQAQRYQYKDLAGLDGPGLWRERERAALAAAWLPEGEDRAWAEQRLKAVAGEQARRRGTADASS